MKDLGQRALAKPVPVLGSASDENLEAWCDGTSKGPLRDLRTGTGFADAKLSEILPPLAMLALSG